MVGKTCEKGRSPGKNNAINAIKATSWTLDRKRRVFLRSAAARRLIFCRAPVPSAGRHLIDGV